ncbi:MAG: RNB domain-containing ribonuclease [Candidatus Hodarchaeales archaeon]|jgi:exoribonuclease R
MKQGELIEFRAGLFGIQPPQNMAIILKRYTKKKVVFLEILTVKGIREIKAKQMTKRALNQRIDLVGAKKLKSKQLKADLMPRLEDWITRFSKDSSTSPRARVKEREKEKTRSSPDSHRELWETICKNPRPVDSRTLAEEWYGMAPSPTQVSTVAEILKDIKPGTGYFKQVTKEDDLWEPLTMETYDQIKEDIRALERLRRRLVEVEDYEDEEGYMQQRNIPVEIKYALQEEDKEIFKLVQQWMDRAVEHQSLLTAKEGMLGGTHVSEIDSFSLYQYLRFLAEDWTETRQLLQAASAMVEFLLRTDYWGETEALEKAARRAVAAHPNFSWDVDDDIEKIASEFPEPADYPEEYAGRKDLQHLLAYTIDPATAKDFDQALSFEKHEDRSFTLWVHIADVTHYVELDSSLDESARTKATSVYLPSRVLPMHPPALSTDICALRSGVPRLCLTLKMDFSAEGERMNAEFYEAVIKVKENLSYSFVDEQLEKGDPYFTVMEEFADLLRSKRIGLDIETMEARLSTETHALELTVEGHSRSSEFNAILMIVANEAVGEKLRDSGLPAFYRCHPLPDRDKIERFNEQMVVLGIDCEIDPPPLEFVDETGEIQEEDDDEEVSVLDMLKTGGKMTLGSGQLFSKVKEEKKEDEVEEPGDSLPVKGLAQLSPENKKKWLLPFRKVLEQVNEVEDPDTRLVMHLATLGVMGRAFYTRQNMGHFGLGSSCYTHFTAPIRRYSDNVVHRLLKKILREPDSEEPLSTKEELDELSQHCSDQARAAEDLEYQVKGIGFTMMSRRPEWQGSITGLVTRIHPARIFVLMKKVVDGKIRTSDLTNEEVIVDPAEAIAFKKRDEKAIIKQITSSKDWQEMLDEEGEPIEVLVKIGDKIGVQIAARDYVAGNVTVKPT